MENPRWDILPFSEETSMNRKQRRQLERKSVEIAERFNSAKRAAKARQKLINDMSGCHTSMFLAGIALVLHDRGFAQEEILDVLNALESKISLALSSEDLAQEVKDITGIEILRS